MSAAAISGDFATYRHVQGRKVLQLVIEVPAELAATVFAALGTPGAGEGIPVALARLVTDAKPIAKPEAPKERKPFSELPYSQQAALRCQEPDFIRFLQERQGVGGICHLRGDPSDWVSAHVRWLCDVDSRADIGKTLLSKNLWTDLDAEYFAWSRGMR